MFVPQFRSCGFGCRRCRPSAHPPLLNCAVVFCSFSSFFLTSCSFSSLIFRQCILDPSRRHSVLHLSLFFFFIYLSFFISSYALISKAHRVPDKPAGLTCIGNKLSGAVPRSVSARKTTKLRCHLGPPPPYSYFPLNQCGCPYQLSLLVATGCHSHVKYRTRKKLLIKIPIPMVIFAW